MPCVLAGADCIEARAGVGQAAVVREAVPTVAAEAAEAVAATPRVQHGRAARRRVGPGTIVRGRGMVCCGR